MWFGCEQTKELNHYDEERNNKATLLLDGWMGGDVSMSMSSCRIGVDIDEYA